VGWGTGVERAKGDTWRVVGWRRLIFREHGRSECRGRRDPRVQEGLWERGDQKSRYTDGRYTLEFAKFQSHTTCRLGAMLADHFITSGGAPNPSATSSMTAIAALMLLFLGADPILARSNPVLAQIFRIFCDS
jgi:hypothetical protein